MPDRRVSVRAVRLGAVAAFAALAVLAPVNASGQDAPHPAHIHAGTCAQLGDVVIPLQDVAGPAQDAQRSGPESAIPVESSLTVVDMPLQEIIDGGHAINVHLSMDEIGTYIACGDIGGAVMTDEGESDPELVIGLGELNDSGYTGIAWLGADGDQTRVAIDLIASPAATAATGATPAATPEASVTDIQVTIKDFKFQPATIDVPVGGSVTWTNEDATPHTATGVDRAVLQSGTLKTGESYTQTFDTPGSYDYFCEFHAGMKGTIVVE